MCFLLPSSNGSCGSCINSRRDGFILNDKLQRKGGQRPSFTTATGCNNDTVGATPSFVAAIGNELAYFPTFCFCLIQKFILIRTVKILSHTKFSTVSRLLPLTPLIFSLPPQDIIITVNMLLVTHLQYLSQFMGKNKTVFLRFCKSKKKDV